MTTMKPGTWLIVAALVLAGCDQDDGNWPADTDTWDTAGDTVEDTGPGDVAVDTGTDSADVPTDETFTIPEAGTFTESMTVDGVNRAYVVHIPASAVAAMSGGRVPFLIALHGAGDTGSNFIAATRLTNTADTNGFVVVGPDGYNRGWFVQDSEGWPATDGNSTSLENDTAYMLDLIEHGYESWGIDRNRIYVTGHSRGAGMTTLLAIASGSVTTVYGSYSSPFAAYGINAGYDPYGGSLGYGAEPKRPVWIIHGDADSVVPFSAGEDLNSGMSAAGWDVTWTPVSGGSHTWLFDAQELWDYFAANPLP
jgi:poly(3-hydroxybutyrate) depolymerase